MTTLGIISGGGDLPRAIAESAQSSGRSVHVLALMGSAGAWVEAFPHSWVGLGETTKAFRALRDANCHEVVLAGQVERPKFSEIKLDARSVLLAPRVIAAARKGDDALLRALVELFEREGFSAVGAAQAAPGLVVGKGAIGRRSPSSDSLADIELGLKVVDSMGALDVGQAAVV
ncbi:MAG: UDP-2,3-diacylglucosamine diphosphatase LpxI, partial [Alphaproteobacteria bacterium]|nr:UDP-2,3-diacylglucosamine diphosphatase LpxI [Alphaproteobacteria bacterium]